MPRDRRILVPKRLGVGWSPNLRDPVGVAIVVALVLVAVAFVAWATLR
jgi:uncharacterized membrane protein